MPFASGAVYAMSKSALKRLVQGMARDLGPKGITVNNVQPGPVDTDMNPEDAEAAASLHGMMALPVMAIPMRLRAWWRIWRGRNRVLSPALA